ncbi:acetoacetate--CoA ligase [Streptomyces sp. SID12501]|uniref:Acetoacetate--CoA ligase n=2 Tax=Streptomyces sp. SID12501 TaxID=2706042 RepID=A0A6B3BNH8_9ACTN|nr:acetoacetate--CoA ligase [Streptomyces sp. SID12501]
MDIDADVLWTPPVPGSGGGELDRFLAWLDGSRRLSFDSYGALWKWSTQEIEQFWRAIWDYYDVGSNAGEVVLEQRVMPGAVWFPGATVNYAQEMLTRAPREHPALVSVSEDGAVEETSTAELTGQVGALARTLREIGVGPGDRVAAYLPNVAEAVVALLATASLGAIWTSCAPDFGAEGVIGRFQQVEPKVLIAVEGYHFGGRYHDRGAVLRRIEAAIPSLRRTIVVRPRAQEHPPQPTPERMPWADAIAQPAEPRFEEVPFSHPLWILFSSGTTGRPKGIVHSHGGIVLEHLKTLNLGAGVGAGDRYYFYSSTNWMVWNLLVGALLAGATAVLYDGSPVHPDPAQSWRVAAAARATVFGSGAAYLTGCERAGVKPVAAGDLSALTTVVSTGSPLPPSTWSWIHDELGPAVRLDSCSGGTDVCSAFVGGSPWLPVIRGELSAPALGAKIEAFDEGGEPVVGALGELVITEPMPSMPVGFWNDPDGARYRDAYFSAYPGVWRHGDWIEFTERGGIVMQGRSDATLNRGGVRMGSADLYSVVDLIPGVADSLVIGLELPDGGYYMPLFVVTADHADQAHRSGLEAEIRDRISAELSRRHLPDEIVFAPAVPRTLTGKRLEVPVKQLLLGRIDDRGVARESVVNADSLGWYAEFGRRRIGSRGGSGSSASPSAAARG